MYQTCPIIDAPPIARRTVGLFESIPPTSMDDLENDGFRWHAVACDGPDAHQTELCPVEYKTKPPGAPPYVHAHSCLEVTLVAAVSCETVGNLAAPELSDETLFGIAEDKLRYGAAYTLGEAMSTGKAWKRVLDEDGCPTGEREIAFQLLSKDEEPITPFCVEDPITPCPDPVDPYALISNFENCVGDCSLGAPVIYMPAIARAYLVGACGPVFKEGERYFTAGEIEVVFGWGFHGVDPVTCEKPEDGTVWGVMRDRAIIKRSGLWDTAQGDRVSNVRREKNDRTFYVEEDFAVGFGPCCSIIQQMELCR